MKRRLGLLLAIAVMAVPAAWAEKDNDKLDPDAATSGPPPFDSSKMDSYTTNMLVTLLEVYQNIDSPNAKRLAEIIADELSRRDGSARPDPVPSASPEGSAASGSGPARPTTVVASPQTGPASGASARPSSQPSATAASGSRTAALTPSARGTSSGRGDWYARALQNLTDFWANDAPTADERQSALRKGQIYDPRTRKVVDLDEHIRSVGLHDAFSDELANVQPGMGSQQRLNR